MRFKVWMAQTWCGGCVNVQRKTSFSTFWKESVDISTSSLTLTKQTCLTFWPHLDTPKCGHPGCEISNKACAFVDFNHWRDKEIKVSAFLIRWFTGQKGCLVTGGLQDNFIVYKVLTLACSLSEYEYIYIYIFIFYFSCVFPYMLPHTGANNFPLGRESPCRVAAVRLS